MQRFSGLHVFMLAMLLLWQQPLFANQFTISQADQAESLQSCVHYVRAAYLAMEYQVELIPYPGRRALQLANLGKVDAELCRVDGIQKQYSNLIKVPVRIGGFNVVAVTINDEIVIKSASDLSRYKLGGIRGMKATENYFTSDNIQYGDDTRQLLRLLEQRMIDVAIITDSSLPKQQNLKMFQLREHSLYHYIHRSHAHLLSELVEQLTKSLKDDPLGASVK